LEQQLQQQEVLKPALCPARLCATTPPGRWRLLSPASPPLRVVLPQNRGAAAPWPPSLCSTSLRVALPEGVVGRGLAHPWRGARLQPPLRPPPPSLPRLLPPPPQPPRGILLVLQLLLRLLPRQLLPLPHHHQQQPQPHSATRCLVVQHRLLLLLLLLPPHQGASRCSSSRCPPAPAFNTFRPS
jgi:hypothetical protein